MVQRQALQEALRLSEVLGQASSRAREFLRHLEPYLDSGFDAPVRDTLVKVSQLGERANACEQLELLLANPNSRVSESTVSAKLQDLPKVVQDAVRLVCACDLLRSEAEMPSDRAPEVESIESSISELKNAGRVDALTCFELQTNLAARSFLNGHPSEARDLLSKARSAGKTSPGIQKLQTDLLRDLVVSVTGKGEFVTDQVTFHIASMRASIPLARGPPPAAKHLLPEARMEGFRSSIVEPPQGKLPPLVEKVQKIEAPIRVKAHQEVAKELENQNTARARLKTEVEFALAGLPPAPLSHAIPEADDDEEDERFELWLTDSIRRAGSSSTSDGMADFQLLEMHINQGVSHVKEGEFHHTVREFGAALATLRELERAFVIDPTDVKLNEIRGNLLVSRALARAEDYEAAVVRYAKAIELAPNDPENYTGRASALVELKRYEDAISDYDKGIELDPQKSHSYVSRGIAKRGSRQYQEALADYDTALKNNPEDSWAMSAKAWILATCDDDSFLDGEESLKLAKRACEIDEWKDAISISVFAAANAEIENFDEAVRWQKEAIKLASEREAEDFPSQLEFYLKQEPYRDNVDGNGD